MDHDLEKTLKMKLILGLFEQSSGMKINFHKGGVFLFVSVKLTRLNMGISTSLVARLVLFPSNIWELPFTIVDLTIVNGSL
jgi:hypothetical protein